MKILSISLKTPSLAIDNETILSLVAEHNRHHPISTVKRYQRELAFLLKKAGARMRYFRDRESSERAIDFVRAATEEALANAQLDKSAVDLIIYCGVGKGFLEPSSAYFCAQAMDMNCNCFDVSDACMSWARALEVAHTYLKTSSYRNILIVNAEFTAYEYGYPEAFKIRDEHQLEYTFPAYTIGEGATATVVTASNQDWSFRFESEPRLANLCTIPLVGYDQFCESTDKIGLNGINGFVSFGGKLFDIAVERMVRMINENIADKSEPAFWFPHGAAADPGKRAAELLGLDPHKVYTDAFVEYGNLISASIPAALHKAASEKRLERDMNIVLCPASAGMSFGLIQFTY